GASVDRLDVVVLSALEGDTNFNVNVLTGSDGVLRGASGGHCDTAVAAALSIIVAATGANFFNVGFQFFQQFVVRRNHD
ncbi:citrate lyase subunit alpha, partial [Citrobacter freundii]